MGTNRRELLLAGAGLAAGLLSSPQARAQTARSPIGDGPDWTTLESRVEGRLALVEWPLESCLASTGRGDCGVFFASARNPYFLGDHPALTQTLGWADAWVSKPSERVLEAASAPDIAAAIRFACDHGVRLVVKGGGHSYTGGSNAAGSLLVWTSPDERC
jgi:hypothetical protein